MGGFEEMCSSESEQYSLSAGFHLAEWLVQTRLGIITRRGQTISLEPKTMDVLVCLRNRAGDVVPKEQLIRGVWQDAFVTDEVLTNAISTLRKAL